MLTDLKSNPEDYLERISAVERFIIAGACSAVSRGSDSTCSVPGGPGA